MATTRRRDRLQRIETVADLRRALSAWEMYRHLPEPASLGADGVEVWRMAQACVAHAATVSDPTDKGVWGGLGSYTIRDFQRAHGDRSPNLDELHAAFNDSITDLGRRFDPATATIQPADPTRAGAAHDSRPSTLERSDSSRDTVETPGQPYRRPQPDPWQDRLRAIDNWADELYAATVDGPEHASATAIYLLGETTWRDLADRLGRPPTPHEHVTSYLAALETLGYRWDEKVFTMRPILAAAPSEPPLWHSEPHLQLAGPQPAGVDPQPVSAEGQPQDGPRVWFLSADELAATRVKIGRINDRALAKGYSGTVGVEAVPATRSHIPGPGAATVTVHGFNVTITGDPPCYQGWQFLAAVDMLAVPAGTLRVQPMIIGADGTGWPHPDPDRVLCPGERRALCLTRTDDSGITERLGEFDTAQQADAALQRASRPGLVVRYLPGAEQTLDHDSIRAGECDHCHTQRDRSSVLVVRHEDTGEVKQVGRSCVKDFLGWSTLPVLIDPDQAERAIEHGSGIEGHDWALADVLRYSWAVIETAGWVPASKAGERTATKDLVAEAICGRGKDADELRAWIGPKLAEATQMAPRIRTDLTAAFANSSSGYEANLAAILVSGLVHPRKHLGLAVSAVTAWQRLQETAATEAARAAARQQAAERVAGQHHAGTVGEPITMTGTVTVKRSIDGYRWNSPSQVLLVVDCGDAVAKMITSAAWAYQVKPGEQVSVQGVVKAHEVFRDVPQTVLKRPKQLPITEPQPPAIEARPPAEALREPVWETVAPVPSQSRFQEVPVAAHPPLARSVGI